MGIQRYTRTAIVLHWLIAALIVLNVGLAWLWPELPDAQVRPAINWHKSIGILVLGLAVMRILWRATHRPPPMPTPLERWEAVLSTVTHLLLYVIILAMPITGWIMDSAWERSAQNPIIFLNLFELPRLGFIAALDPDTKKALHDGFGAAHANIAKLLYVLFALHVAGALKHQFVDRQPELQRMGIGRRRG